MIATATPTLSVSPVTNPSGAATLYCFKVSTGFDGRSGTVVDSGCLKDPKWTVPKNVLRDGGKYTWTALTALAGGVTTTTPQWVGHFSIDQRMGDSKVSVVDEVGPLSVNLFNGNLRTNSGGPQFTSVGGESGITLAYNSRGGEAHGLRASYFNDSSHAGKADDVAVLVRTEPQVNLSLANTFPGHPNPIPTGLNKDWFVIRWEGYFKAPVAGDFRFVGEHAEGAKIWIDGKVVYDSPKSLGLPTDLFSATATPKRDDEVSLKTGQRVPVKVELYHRNPTVMQVMALWVKSTTDGGFFGGRVTNLMPQVVKTEHLYSADPAPLPGGWTLGVAGSGYSRAEMLDGSVILTDTTGAKHTWAAASVGGYTPPVGEDGVLAVDGFGKITVTVGDVVSVFNPDGSLATVASVLDSKKPAALQYLYSGTPPRLTQIKDPVSGRSHTLHYNTNNSGSCYGGATKPTGKSYVYDSHDTKDPDDPNKAPYKVYMDVIAAAPPPQMLCRITYWDGTETRLWYSHAGTLDRIENPGGEVRDYTYEKEATAVFRAFHYGVDSATAQQAIDRLGPMNQTRGSLATDWLSRQSSSLPKNAEAFTVIYRPIKDSFALDDQASARPSIVYQPVPVTPDGSKPARNAHVYEYVGYGVELGKNQAAVRYPGIALIRMRVVTFDDAGRVAASTDADGVTTTTEWNIKDKPVAVTDGTGRRITNIYDHADRLTDSFGPAPASCFDGLIPTAECAKTMPHSHVGYDEGTLGLQTALYDNPYLSGVPSVWQTGVGTSDGALSRNWGATPPVANSSGWSGRFTGEIQFPAAGEYKLGFTVIDGVRLWIDDVLIVDSWTDKPATAVSGIYTNTTAGKWHRVRIDYYNRSGNTGALNFTWTPPGTGAMVTIPGQHLAPRYGYETSEVGYSSSGGSVERAPSTVVTTGYSDPANGIDPVYGLVVSKTHDPGGANLVRSNSFEQPGDGYLRKLAQALPAGDITNPDERGTFAYYGGTETRKNPCDSTSAAVSQVGMIKTVTSAPNADGSPNVLETVYDSAGRIVATRINDEPWSCVTYDARGRVAKKSFPAMGDQPGRTITFDYAVGGNPLIQRVSDESGSTTTAIDLLGQVLSYTDATGVVTTSKYDTEGRKTSETTTIKGVTSTLNYGWTRASRLIRLDLDGTTVATPPTTRGCCRA
ncbi:PA14 domain-containing protein [Nocardia crassostreae]|uniref:PA14 domain-containing protein n=1 Tax=Nocardia crassostreae TaxID=53428 RepID=UPI0014717A97|nr:PA14 domain-containing protein [Nocardia crassostreae]